VDEEQEILMRRIARGQDNATVKAVTDHQRVAAMQRAVENVFIHRDIVKYIATIIALTREDPRLEVGASPRGSLALLKLSRSHAAIRGRAYVVPDDVRTIAVPALAHRVILQPEARLKGIRAEQIVEEILAKVPVPAV
jgi:MoxR-like ATPase